MTSNWEIRNPDAAATTTSSGTSSGSMHAPSAQTHYSLTLESIRGPQSLGNHIPTPLPERGGTEAESPHNSDIPKLNTPEVQVGTPGSSVGVTPAEENIVPLPIPPSCHLVTIDTAAVNTNAEVQDAVLQALMHIHATASTKTGGSFCYD